MLQLLSNTVGWPGKEARNIYSCCQIILIVLLVVDVNLVPRPCHHPNLVTASITNWNGPGMRLGVAIMDPEWLCMHDSLSAASKRQKHISVSSRPAAELTVMSEQKYIGTLLKNT